MKFHACALLRLSSESVPDPVDSMAVSSINHTISIHAIKRACKQASAAMKDSGER
jgi:hypothetical protein